MNMKIHQVKTRLVNTYVIEYPDRIFVMDVALGCHRYVLGFIEHELKRDIHDVKLVICSHDDPDHMGGLRRLAALCHAEIAIPHYSGALREKFLGDPAGFFIRAITSLREGLRARMWTMYFNPKRGQRARKKPKYQGKKGLLKSSRHIKQWHRIAGNQSLPGFEDWQVLHTPGHSWDSCCYYHEQSGSLLSGDTLLGSAKQNRVVIPSIYANAKQTEESLAVLRQLNITAVYPGHGSVIATNDNPLQF
jgi:glyoxylase-like metal-dependent hydrolase (beta-lactamase superfamily II)